MSTTAAQFPTTTIGVSKLNRWLALIPILFVALAIRIYYLPYIGYIGDIEHFNQWMHIMEEHGVLNFYQDEHRMGVWDRTYPPLSTWMYEAQRILYGELPAYREVKNTEQFIMAMKVFPVLAELVMIGAVYAWLLNRSLWIRTLIPIALALHPGMVITSTWWGQNDPIYTMFLLLALLAINRDRWLISWIMFALAVMIKQPAVFLGPLLLVLTFRRYGLRASVISLAVSGAVCLALFAPFLTTTSPELVFKPYLQASDAFPYFSNNSYNFWHGLASLHKGAYVLFEEKAYRDSQAIIGAFTYKTAGLTLFGVCVLLILVVAWKHHQNRHEFIWATALFFAFFTLPTQVHERYLYTAAVFAVVAAAQDRRFWIVALGLAPLYTYNLLVIAFDKQTLGRSTFGRETWALPTAIGNTLLFIVTLWLLRPKLQQNQLDNI